MRIDKWLFFSRLFKTRSKVVKAIDKSKIFLNGSLVRKQSQIIKIGDGIIIKRSNDILRFKVINFGTKRENYDLAKNMYENKIEELQVGISKTKAEYCIESEYSFRPDKKERRALIKLKKISSFLEE